MKITCNVIFSCEDIMFLCLQKLSWYFIGVYIIKINNYWVLLFFSGTQDEQIRREKVTYRIDGGCAALVALFLGKRLYVANAGDCR